MPCGLVLCVVVLGVLLLLRRVRAVVTSTSSTKGCGLVSRVGAGGVGVGEVVGAAVEGEGRLGEGWVQRLGRSWRAPQTPEQGVIHPPRNPAGPQQRTLRRRT